MVAVAVDADYYVGLVDYVAVVDAADAEAVVDAIVAVVVGARQLPQFDVGVAVVVDDGLVDVVTVVAVDAHQSDKSTDVPGAGPVT